MSSNEQRINSQVRQNKINKKLDNRQVADLLKVNIEVLSHLRKEESLPYFTNKRFIAYWERDVIRWRNRMLTKNRRVIVNLKNYYRQSKLEKFFTYKEFKSEVLKKIYMEGDNCVQYLKKQNVEKDLLNIVGDMVSEYHNRQMPKCKYCGRTLYSNLENIEHCSPCKLKISQGLISPGQPITRQEARALMGITDETEEDDE